MLGHESQLLTGTLCAVFHCWEWKKLSMEVEKGFSTCREPSLIVPPRSCCRGVPAGQRAPHFCKTASEQQEKKPRCTKSSLQPQNSLSACAESELPTAGAVGTHLSHATGREQPRRVAGKPCVPGMQLKPETEASFTLCIFSFRHAGFDFFFFFAIKPLEF